MYINAQARPCHSMNVLVIFIIKLCNGCGLSLIHVFNEVGVSELETSDAYYK